MPSFENILVVAISTRALFDLEEENNIFHEQGADAYRKYQRDHEEDILNKGTAFYLIEALLSLNKLSEERLVEVIIMSKNSPETGIRVLNSIDNYGLDITRSAFTGSEPLSIYMKALSVDLFLSRDEGDVQATIDSKAAAAALIYDPPQDYQSATDAVRIAFDADAVLFSEESEYIYKTAGMKAFHDNEKSRASEPLKDGPYAKVLRMLSEIQVKIKAKHDESPLRIAIVTARNSPSHRRVLNTLREWNVQVDEAFFLGGIEKHEVLRAFKAHIFFDDQEVHLEKSSRIVPSGRVPYATSSQLRNLNLANLKIAQDVFTIPLNEHIIFNGKISEGILSLPEVIQFKFAGKEKVIQVVFMDRVYKCKIEERKGELARIHLGRKLSKHLELSKNSQLRFILIAEGKYSLVRIR